MFAGLFLAVPVLVLLALGGLVLLLLTLTARPDHTLPSEVASARRHALVTSAAAAVVFLGTTGFLVWYATGRPTPGSVPPTPTWLGALPLLGAAAALTTLTLGELTWPRPRGQQRQATLNPRSAGSLLPHGWRVTAVAAMVVTGPVLLAGLLLADVSGRSITATGLGDGRISATSGPFPGSFYVVPQLLAFGLVALLAWGALRLVVLRPAVVRADVTTDTRLRASSAARVLRVFSVGLLLTAAGNLVFGGAAAANAYDTGWQHLLGTFATFAGAGLGLLAGGVLLAPAPRLSPSDGPVVPQPARVESS